MDGEPNARNEYAGRNRANARRNDQSASCPNGDHDEDHF